MPACERCWAEYRRRLALGENITYSQVVAESDQRGGCTADEQCGEMHLVLDWVDGTRHCRCGAVIESCSEHASGEDWGTAVDYMRHGWVSEAFTFLTDTLPNLAVYEMIFRADWNPVHGSYIRGA